MRARWMIITAASAILATACDSRTSWPDRGRGRRPGAPPAQPTGDLAQPLATVDGVTITVGEFQDRLNRQSPYIRNRYTSFEQKAEFLDSLVRFEVLAAEAARRGLDADPEVVRTMKQVMIQKLLRDEFETRVTPASITDAEVAAYYEKNQAEFVKQEEVRASAIVVLARAQAERVLLEAQGEAGKTNKGFRDLVGKYSSNEEHKLRGGDLRYLTEASTEVPKPVIAAAFALANVGDVSGVVDAGDGTFWILKQTGRRKAVVRTLDEAAQTIRNKLYRDKRQETQKAFIDGLRKAAKIEILEDNLAKVRVDTSAEGGDPHGEGPALPDLNQPLPPPSQPGVMPSPPPLDPAPVAPQTTPPAPAGSNP
jgi:peptidyl-prolyl cis-trans isomerase C